jgi:HAD superfamily hydrolase (TIGR01509 family)
VSEIDCVVFDIGNVLIRWDPRNLYRRMGYADATTSLIMSETGLLELNHRALDAGAPFAATIAELAVRFPQHAPFIRAFDTRWSEMLAGAIAPSVEILDNLKRSGFPVHAISNFSREKFDVTRNLFPFLNRFDELIVSGDIGMVKPDAEIFDLLIQRRKLDPRRTVFIDDSAPNIATARQLGFVTIHFSEDRTDLRAELVGLGLAREAVS